LRPLYALLVVCGYAAANWFVVLVSIRTGNLMLWTRPAETLAGLFATPISTAFALDLVAVVLVACIWFQREGRRLGMRRIWVYWLLTLVFGLGGTLPLFLLHRERRLEIAGDAAGASRV
jgi:hypothetical protein